MHNVLGVHVTVLGVFLAIFTSIPFKKTVYKRRIGTYYEFPNPNKSELEIKFNVGEEQQLYFHLWKRKSYESPGTGTTEIKRKITANDIIRHKLESDYIYRIDINMDSESKNLNTCCLNFELSLIEYKHLPERYFHFFLTFIPIGFVIYYSP